MENEKQKLCTSDDIVWSINSNTDAPVDDWIDENQVGYKQEYEIIPQLDDGEYMVCQIDYSNKREVNLESKIVVSNGKVYIQSCKEAVAEFMNRTGDWHYFIEMIYHDKKTNKLSFFLGS